MMLSDLSSDQEATGSNSHGGGGDVVLSNQHVLLNPLFAPAQHQQALLLRPAPQLEQQPMAGGKRKRSQPGNPDPGAEVIALSPRALVATNRFVCEICNKGFQRDQNLQLHRRGHNLPWKLRQRSSSLQAPHSCVHHDPARALGDLTGIKKHFSRKHGEKRWKCERCGKRYAVHSDWKAHVKNCGTREYRCDCGILFSRKDSLLTHRAFCDALAEESARILAAANNSSTSNNSNIINNNNNSVGSSSNNLLSPPPALFPTFSSHAQNPNPLMFLSEETHYHHHHQQEQLLPPFQPQYSYLSHVDLPISSAITSGVSAFDTDRDTLSFGLTPEGSVTMHAGGRRGLTRDFLGAGEVVEDQLQMPLCSAAAYQGRPVATAVCCATTDLTRQYLGRLPPVSETWSHHF
ncbi:protein indeterminate-domain 9 isoform X2 [Brachypodium distachyon]|uniref:protein indeterminate-domain 9 isoform X2 n=1 Tax=Brachypodium distachyon TaxID=15368 RepID=UPI000D0CA23C|nr:protein indeterminate-domain 9 isoform X2 [Brachypodium distachyon]|eukprot:XP_024318237.1 protein indeterminate-domain 9 isoform X2 [Brachypodium distachyon]